MEEIEVKIKEVQNYFKQRILKGEFELIECGEYHVTISTEKEYYFTFWIGNGEAGFCQYLTNGYLNFIDLELEVEENFQLFKIIEPLISKYNETILKTQKMQEYLKLQKELEL